MDLKNSISLKRNELLILKDDSGIDSVLRHIDIAQKHFDLAIKSGSEDYFTDVIYRTNQVFEGILKELYEVSSKKKSSKLTPANIEKYLENEDKLSSRVLKYFTMYRQDWRNPSTHDHKIDFNEQEAFVAISNVCTFCYVAIDQMIYLLAEEQIKVPNQTLNFNKFEKLGSSLVKLMEMIGQSFKEHELSKDFVLSEIAIEGLISGLLGTASADAKISREHQIANGSRSLQIDVFVENADKKFAYEIKSYIDSSAAIASFDNGLAYLDRVLSESDTDFGILLLLPRKVIELQSNQFEFRVSDENKNVLVVSTKEVFSIC